MKILELLIRIFIDREELDATIAFYEKLFCSKCKMRFQYPEAGLELAQIKSVLLIAGTKSARQSFQKTKATFLVESAEYGHDIDPDRALLARERAEKRLAQAQAHTEDVNRIRAEASLQRAIARISTAQRTTL